MKTTITATVIALSSLFAVNVAHATEGRCNNEPTIFSADTEKGNKHVLVCYIKAERAVHYEYGKIGKKADMVIEKPFSEVETGRDAKGSEWIAISNGSHTYQVGESIYTNGDGITVYKGSDIWSGKELAHIGIKDERTNNLSSFID